MVPGMLYGLLLGKFSRIKKIYDNTLKKSPAIRQASINFELLSNGINHPYKSADERNFSLLYWKGVELVFGRFQSQIVR